MNLVYYIVSAIARAAKVHTSGGHGYSYDPNVVSKRMVRKDSPTAYGYFVNGNLQSMGVDPINFYNGRIINQPSEVAAFLTHFKAIVTKWLEEESGSRILIITNGIKGVKHLTAGKLPKDMDEEFFNSCCELYKKHKDSIIIDLDYYAKGGEGVKNADKQGDISNALAMFPNSKVIDIECLTPKEYKDPEIEFNKIVTGNRWFFNTGDASNYYETASNGYRRYEFGRIDPKKGYFGKATPDVFYSILFSKEPIQVLDKLFEFCKENVNNPCNLLSAGNVPAIKSKEIAKVINTIPGVFDKKNLVAPMALSGGSETTLVEHIDPPGLSYRIVAAMNSLDIYHEAFLKRGEDNKFGKCAFIDITDKFFVKVNDKLKLSPEFTNEIIKYPIFIDSPHCPNKVKIQLSIKYDTPERNSLNSLIASKVNDAKVWLILDFSNEGGVSYGTITETPDFNYIHVNSNGNLHVYSLKELGRK